MSKNPTVEWSEEQEDHQGAEVPFPATQEVEEGYREVAVNQDQAEEEPAENLPPREPHYHPDSSREDLVVPLP